MSNKTSDKNVANVTKRDIDNLTVLINAYEAGLPGCNELMNYEVSAIKNILAELEQKDKRIQKLEKQLQKYYNGELYTAKQLKNLENNQKKYFINKQVVIDVLQNNRNELFSMTCLSKEQYRPYEMQIERINKIEQELLEGEK